MEVIQGWYNSFFGNGFVTKLMIKDKITHCNITYYTKDNMLHDKITINDNKGPCIIYHLLNGVLSSLEYHQDNVVYDFVENMRVTSLRYDNKVVFQHRNGGLLQGDIIIGEESITYRDGNIMSATYNGNLYRRIEEGDYPLYIVYTSNGIYGYLQGVIISIISGQSKYALMADGYILGYMSNIDTNVHVQWKGNVRELLKLIKGYNPCNKINLLPEHYFDDELWLILKNNNITVEMNKYLNTVTVPIRYFATRSVYMLYDQHGSIVELFGYHPNLSIKGGNLHGLISLGTEYYYYNGIMQWRRDGNLYIVRYNDDHPIKMTIYSDRIIYHDKSYMFENGFVSINDEQECIYMTILYNSGLPIMTTNGIIRNVPPNF